MNALKTLRILAIAGSMVALTVQAQTAAPAAGSGPGTRPGAQGAQGAEALSPAQLAKVKAVLAPYKPGSLTVDDAKAIKRALRDAGMRPSRALDQALRAEGFSAERLEQLDPRPPGPPRDDGPPRKDGSGPPTPAPGKAPPA